MKSKIVTIESLVRENKVAQDDKKLKTIKALLIANGGLLALKTDFVQNALYNTNKVATMTIQGVQNAFTTKFMWTDVSIGTIALFLMMIPTVELITVLYSKKGSVRK